MSNQCRGLIAIFLYCLSAGLSGVWVFFDFSTIKLSVWLLAFVIFLIASAVFGVAQSVQHKDPLRLIKLYPKDMLILNSLTLVNWVGMFAALLIAEASFESAICQGWIPITVLLCDLLVHRVRLISLRTLGSFLITISLFLLVGARLLESETLAISPEALQNGIILATLSGFSNGFYLYYASHLHRKTSCSILDILCSRFLLLLIATGFMSAHEMPILFQSDMALLGKLLLLTLFSVVLPVLTYQYAIAKLGSAQISLIIPLVPVLSLTAELMMGHWHSVWIPILITVTCVLVGLSNFWLQKTESNSYQKTN